MLIEIFTDGSILVDGQARTDCPAEKILYDYLMDPAEVKIARRKPAKKAA